MKKLNFYILVLIVFVMNSYSQVPYYYYQVPSGTTNNLYDIEHFSNYSNLVFICGDNGTLIKITNADSGCFNYTPVTTERLNGVLTYNFFTPVPYFVFGNNGLFIKSINFGNTWSLQYSGFSNNLNSGTLISGGTNIYKYFAVGSNGLIIKRNFYPFNDTLWSLVQSGTVQNLKSIYSSDKYGWIVGENGTILKSLDTFKTWVPLFSVHTNNFNSIKFLDTLNGIVVGTGGVILKTTNGGLNWLQKTSYTTQDLNDIAILRDTIIYISGNKVVLYSTNDGNSWTLDSGVPQYNLFACNFIYSSIYKKSIPFFVGEGGRIYKKTLDSSYNPNYRTNLSAGNINSYFNNKGQFDYKPDYEYSGSGFEWPKGSNKTAIYCAGLCIGGYVNGQLREAMVAYDGDYRPGYCSNSNFYTNDYFKIYKVNKSDNSLTNWDWQNWGQMVPYGAPYIDVNNNNIYEPLIDTPGVKNAKETLFLCMSDADTNSHSSYVYFGGSAFPLGAEVHMTAWAYDLPGLQDVQFISYDIINKSTSSWNAVKMGIFCDPDLGDAQDDYIGCDTSLDLAFCYNSDNEDGSYGVNPPAVGFTLLKGPLNRCITPNVRLGMISFVNIGKYNPTCESILGGTGSYGAYLMLSGFKKDSSCYLDPTQNPPKKTKFCYPGGFGLGGWSEYEGSIWNCNRDSTGSIVTPNPNGDRIFAFGSGADNFNIIPGESQKFVIAQLIARGTSNLNSVTRLKQLCDSIRNFYSTNFPIGINNNTSVVPKEFKLFQNYPNPFNPSTNIKFQIKDSRFVTLKVYDILGKEITTLVNGKYNQGVYEVTFDGSNLPSGVYFYKIVSDNITEIKKMVLIK